MQGKGLKDWESWRMHRITVKVKHDFHSHDLTTAELSNIRIS